MNKKILSVALSMLVAVLTIGCAHIPGTKNQIHRTATVMRHLVPDVLHNQCNPNNYSAEIPHWELIVLPGNEPNSCTLEAHYKYAKQKEGTLTPLLSLEIKQGSPASVVKLQIQETSSVAEDKSNNIVSSFVQTYSPNKKTCYQKGGHMDKDLGCIVF